jgi:hypothetical protein
MSGADGPDVAMSGPDGPDIIVVHARSPVVALTYGWSLPVYRARLGRTAEEIEQRRGRARRYDAARSA